MLYSPTPHEIEYFNELRAEFLADVGDVNKFVEKQIPEINDLLKKNNGGALWRANRWRFRRACDDA